MVKLFNFAQDLRDFDLEFGNILSNHSPNQFYVDPQIVVDEHIPKRGESGPLDIRICSLEISGQPLSSFSHSVEIAQDRILVKPGADKRFFARTSSAFDSADHIEDVLQIGFVALHSATASVKT